jgi:hypothetical protein
MRNSNPAYCDPIQKKKPNTTRASAHIPCGLQADMAANPHGVCVSGVVLFKKIKNFLKTSYSTVTLFARLRGLSTSVPRARAVW